MSKALVFGPVGPIVNSLYLRPFRTVLSLYCMRDTVSLWFHRVYEQHMSRSRKMEKILGRNLIDLIIIIASIAFAGPAAAFTFQDDPSCTWSGDA